MQQDATRTLGEIHGSEALLVEELLGIQKCRLSNRDVSQGRDLRFLCVPEVAPSNPQDEGSEEIGERVVYLQRTEHGEHKENMNYVAVSYCWVASEDIAVSPRVCYKIKTKNGIRPSACPSHVLTRAIRYANAHGVPYIWVDQDCIDQDDAEEKEQAVQTMDVVYSRSKYPLGLLNTQLVETQPIMSLGRLHEQFALDNTLLEAKETAIDDVLRFFSDLARDLWFTRAWVYQEIGCSRHRMTMLIPSLCRELEEQWGLGITPHEVELEFSVARRMVSTVVGRAMMDALNAYKHGEEEESTEKEARVKSSFGLLERSFQLDTGIDSSHEPGIPGFQPASRVVAQLHHLDCRDVVDKLAIMANMCDYAVRLNSSQLVERHSSLSMSMLALALLNGHSGFFRSIEVFACGDKYAHLKPRYKWLSTYAFSILHQNESAREWFNDPSSLEPRLASVTLSKCGLEARGWLWKLDEKISLLELRSKYEKLRSCTLQTFGWDLARILKNRGYSKLEESILKTVGPYPATLEGDGEDNADPRLRVPVTAKPPGSPLQLDSVQRRIDDPGQWFYLMFQFVRDHGYIWAGRLDGEREPRGIFYYLDDWEEPPTLFTSTQLDLDRLEPPFLGYNFVVLEVEQAGRLAGIPTLHCDGRWAGGMWYAPKSGMGTYCFPWAHSYNRTARRPPNRCG